jgi:hypothetical protein
MAINKQQLQALDDLIDSIEDFQVEQDPVNKFLDRVKKNLEEFGFVASGNMYQSLKALPSTKKGKNISEVNIEAEDYWQDLENGTKAKGFSKEERKKLQPKILEWIKAKPSLQELAGSLEKQRSLSYAIATNILKNGTIKRFGYRGKPFLTQEIPQLREDIIKQWQ